MAVLRQFTWYVQTFGRKYSKIILVSSAVGLLAFIILPRLLALIPTVKPTTYIGRVGLFSLSSLPRSIQEKVSFGLTKIDDHGVINPALATSFRPEEDGRAFRFTIRPDAVWQDGSKVATRDVTYSFSDLDILYSQSDIVFRLKSEQNEAISVGDARQTTEQVLPVSFLSIVSQPLFREEKGRGFLWRPTYKIIGLGAYSITSVKYQGSVIKEMTLESADERIVYRFYATEHDGVIAFKKGNVDKLEEMHSLEDLSNWSKVGKQLIKHEDQYLGIFFNLNAKIQDNPIFSNRTLRTALNLALQKPQGEDHVLSPISRRSWAYLSNEDDIDHFDQDMTAAVDSLIKTETPVALSFDLTTVPLYVKQVEEIKKQWEKLGALAVEKCEGMSSIPSDQCENKRISVQVRVSNFPDTSNFQVLLIGQSIPADPDQYAFWHSTQQTNMTGFKNTRVDKLLEDGRKTYDQNERKLLYQEFQRLLVKESPVIFLEPIKTYTIWRKQIL